RAKGGWLSHRPASVGSPAMPRPGRWSSFLRDDRDVASPRAPMHTRRSACSMRREMVSVTEALVTPAAPARPTARRPVDARRVALAEGFLGDWQRINREATIPHCIERLESSGVMDNLRRLV